jgi:hypothetical protein
MPHPPIHQEPIPEGKTKREQSSKLKENDENKQTSDEGGKGSWRKGRWARNENNPIKTP